jgi:hypothetical protein
MMNTSDMGMVDVHEPELLNMDSETGTLAESQNTAGDTQYVLYSYWDPRYRQETSVHFSFDI